MAFTSSPKSKFITALNMVASLALLNGCSINSDKQDSGQWGDASVCVDCALTLNITVTGFTRDVLGLSELGAVK
jgi:hypothetical protein